MTKIKIAIFAIAGANLKRELMSQELTQVEISTHLENGLKDLKKLISFYVLNKKGDYRIEIGDKGFNFVGNKFAGSLSQVLNMVAAAEMHKVGRGAELQNILTLADVMEQNIVIEPALLERLELAERVLDGSAPALLEFSKPFQNLIPDETAN